MQETEYNWLRWSSICGGEDNLEVMLYVRTRDGSTKATYLNGILKSTEVHELFASATYEGTNGLASARWTRSETDFLGRTISESRPGFGGSTLVTSNFYDSAGRIIATRSYSVASGSSPLAFAYYAYDESGGNHKGQSLLT